MTNLRLTLACGPYDRTQALRDGTIRPEGIELNYVTLQPAEIFWRMLQFKEFDVSEMSLSNFTTLVSSGWRRVTDPSGTFAAAARARSVPNAALMEVSIAAGSISPTAITADRSGRYHVS